MDQLPHPPEDDPDVAAIREADDDAALELERQLVEDTAKPNDPAA